MRDITRALDGGDVNGAIYLLSSLYNCAYRYRRHGLISYTVYNNAYQFYVDMMRQLI